MIPRFLLATLALTAAGCATLRPPPAIVDAGEWQLRRDAVQALVRWELRGRVAVQLPAQGGQATVRWRHAPDTQEIDLSGPFGAGHVRLRQDAHGIRLYDARARVIDGVDAEELLHRTTGWHVPVSGLIFWVRGVPAVDAAYQLEFDERGRLRVLHQLGWEIQFLAYRDVQGYELPSRLYLTRPLPEAASAAGDVGRIEIRFAISSWDLAL